MPVYLSAARSALPRLAVPADREVGRILRLDAVHDVQYVHALVRRDLVRHEVPAGSVAAPDPYLDVGH